MGQYKTLLFDLDDTLLDFGASEEVALQNLFNDQQFTLTPDIKANYKKINESLWKAYENDEMDRDEVVNKRFALLFEQYGINVDGVALEKNYRRYLSEGHHSIEGALDLIQRLHTEFDLYIVTNGASPTQQKRLKDSGLDPYFKKVFVSEDTGYQKPMKGFFDYTFSHIENLDLSKTLIIGDSFSADVTGGWNAGIDTCWVNIKEQVRLSTEIIPTYEIRKLEEIYGILGIERETDGWESLLRTAMK
ncbi:YjjG family noncanonical pyrimidine nucleotidase [Lysinibacillus sp. SGAir0095]|uniref:YjjG family noncanonical pyrimidine nucleotidase n=1 Tax=Lysinibacillus sp. SGAir0095 TaxID=2070463 RepID=UPI0010CCD16F|nr:YjjG family noncanonical pyrimidine nucleotidase [Lysinibacillus sp. SGAir0095]QCR33415.1 noncanonical pyrimidine nucleotidase, YjjG family [Lysinibacillus sp. SGAir0095]